MIILQLKSTQKLNDLGDISSIIKNIRRRHGYRIRGHEIHQDRVVMNKHSLSERAGMVANFCSKNEIEYLTYHSPIYNDGENIWDNRWGPEIKSSLTQTIQETETVAALAGIRNKVIVIFHLTTYLPAKEFPVSWAKKLELVELTERHFLDFYRSEVGSGGNIIIANENIYPRDHGDSLSLGPYHPLEVVRLEKEGIMTTLDLAHYHLYSNYLNSGSGNASGDLDRRRYGKAPSWEECIKMMAGSLVQIHINDAKRSSKEGEGLSLGEGEIPIVPVLRMVNLTARNTVRGTIEITDGHMQGSKLQHRSAEWLIERIPDILD